MVPRGLTRRQYDLLTFIQQYVDTNGTSPSYDEMAQGIGMASKSGIHRLVTALVKRGHLVYERYACRSVRLVQPEIPVRLPQDLNITLHSIAAMSRLDPNDIIVAAIKDYLLDAA